MKRYLTLVNILLLAAACYFAFLVYGLATAPEPSLPDPADAEKAALPPADDGKSGRRPSAAANGALRPIISRNLFDSKTDGGPLLAKVDVDKLKQTKLNLKLWGTVTGGKREPYAVIEEIKRREQNLFRVGDMIEKATVRLILREKVILNVDGRDEVLEMEKLGSRTGPVRSVANQAPRTPLTRSSQPPAPAASQKPTEQYIELDRDPMVEAMENVDDLLKQVRIRPYIRNGAPEGISLTGIKPNSIFRKMGLRNGDVITGVNEEKLQSVNDAVEMIRQFSESDGLQLQIKRRGREQRINYGIQ